MRAGIPILDTRPEIAQQAFAAFDRSWSDGWCGDGGSAKPEEFSIPFLILISNRLRAYPKTPAVRNATIAN
jgi:hypothetical protein